MILRDNWLRLTDHLLAIASRFAALPLPSVAGLWTAGEYENVRLYCAEDVIRQRKVFYRMSFIIGLGSAL
jgi:hypothetical protein